MPSRKIHNKRKPLIILGLVVFLFLIFVGIQASRARADVNTRIAAMSAGEKVESYIDKHKTVPASIPDVGYTLPKTVRYEKINDKTFQFCEVFQRNNNPSLSKTGLFINLLHDRNTAFIKQNSLNGTYGALTVDDVHQSGIQCQTVYYYSIQ